MSLRIRQIVFAARDLASAVDQVQARLGLSVIFRDPDVAQFGLQNAMFAIGDQFIEIVSPTREDTAAGRHLERHGDSAYMLILQTDALARDRARLAQLGVRIVWESSYPDICAIHLHPKDIGGAIVSLDEATPPSSWRWAGPKWRSEDCGRGAIVGTTIAAREPATLSQRWSDVLGLEAPRRIDDTWRLDIQQGALTFAPTRTGTERIVQFGIHAPGRPLPIEICGTTLLAQ